MGALIYILNELQFYYQFHKNGKYFDHKQFKVIKGVELYK